MIVKELGDLTCEVSCSSESEEELAYVANLAVQCGGKITDIDVQLQGALPRKVPVNMLTDEAKKLLFGEE